MWFQIYCNLRFLLYEYHDDLGLNEILDYNYSTINVLLLKINQVHKDTTLFESALKIHGYWGWNIISFIACCSEVFYFFKTFKGNIVGAYDRSVVDILP